MVINKFALSLCLGLLLVSSGCSRQQSDWQKARETNTPEAYEQFLKKYPSGEFTAQAQSRMKDVAELRDWQKARDADTAEAYQAFLQQYPEGKNAVEARIRVENFTLAQTPSGSGAPSTSTAAATAPQPAPPGAAVGTVPPVAGAGAAVSKASPMQPDTGESGAAESSPAESAPPNSAPPKSSPVKPSSKLARAAGSKPAAASAGAAKSTGRYAVQLGAFRSGSDAANKRGVHLQKEYPKLLGGLALKVVAKKTAGGTLYRLQAVGVTEKHARAICKRLKAKAQPCVVVRPTSV